MPITNTQAVAGILYAETLELEPAPSGDGPDKASLSALRKALAQEIAATSDGEGFAAAAPPPTQSLADPEIYEAWVDCVAAAKEGVAAPAVARAAAFIDDQDPTKDRNRLREYPWLARQAAPPIGRADWRGLTVQLYLVKPGPGVAPGRYPPLKDPRATVAIPGIQPRWLAALMFLAAIALLVWPAVWTVREAVFAPKRVERVEQLHAEILTEIRQVAAACNVQPFSEEGQACRKDRFATLYPDEKQLARVFDESEKALADRLGALRPNLTAPYAVAVLGIVALLMLVSWGLRREVWGFFVDDRGRMSLSRFQFVGWTVVILSAYVVAGMWNIGLKAALPPMEQDLWLLLGVVTLSPLASALILDKRGAVEPNTPGSGSANDQAVAEGQRSPDQKHRWGVLAIPETWGFLQLFSGEEVGNETTVDISRLQQFIFTLITLIAFVAATSTEILTGAQSGEAFKRMPKLGESIVGLLAISHAAYLAAKALPKKA